jgi:hypothetical protein
LSIESIEHLRDTLILGMLVGDAELCASAYRDNAYAISPDGMPIEGRWQIERCYQQLFDAGARGGVLVPETTSVYCEKVIERGVYACFDRPVALGPPLMRGSYVLVADHELDGTLALAVAIWTRSALDHRVRGSGLRSGGRGRGWPLP